MNTPVWYYSQGQRREGPVDLETLVNRIVNMPDPEEILVWREGLAEWTPAGEVVEVACKMPPPLVKRQTAAASVVAASITTSASPPPGPSATPDTNAGQRTQAAGETEGDSAGGTRDNKPANSSKYAAIPFGIAGLFLLRGLLPLANGQVVAGPLFSGLLYLAFGLALVQGHQLANSRFWCLAALPVVTAPIGFLALVGTVLLTVRLRKIARSGVSGPRTRKGGGDTGQT